MKYVKTFEGFGQPLFESYNPYDNVLQRLGSDLKKSAETVQDYLNTGDNKKTY